VQRVSSGRAAVVRGYRLVEDAFQTSIVEAASEPRASLFFR
jgi:hypothetical protein